MGLMEDTKIQYVALGSPVAWIISHAGLLSFHVSVFLQCDSRSQPSAWSGLAGPMMSRNNSCALTALTSAVHQSPGLAPRWKLRLAHPPSPRLCLLPALITTLLALRDFYDNLRDILFTSLFLHPQCENGCKLLAQLFPHSGSLF
jgi:hypothetical protein